MELIQRTLIVSSGEKGTASLRARLAAEGYDACETVSSAREARTRLRAGDWRLIVINAPLSDETGEALAREAAAGNAGVLLLVCEAEFDEISAHVEADGVLTLTKPLGHTLFHQALHLLAALAARQNRIAQTTRQLEGKLEESRLVSRAKCTLMEYLGMTEANAHRYIEKQAMNMRLTRREVAENILRAYTP